MGYYPYYPSDILKWPIITCVCQHNRPRWALQKDCIAQFVLNWMCTTFSVPVLIHQGNLHLCRWDEYNHEPQAKLIAHNISDPNRFQWGFGEGENILTLQMFWYQYVIIFSAFDKQLYSQITVFCTIFCTVFLENCNGNFSYFSFHPRIYTSNMSLQSNITD